MSDTVRLSLLCKLWSGTCHWRYLWFTFCRYWSIDVL